MNLTRTTAVLGLTATIFLTGCGVGGAPTAENDATMERIRTTGANPEGLGGNTIWDLFRQRDDGTTVAVNRYLWNASLDVLSFLPVESVDPFTGVITTGYGVPPGGGQAYRATILVSDPALEARSLHVALMDRSGRQVATSTQRAVEDAILTRARQLRVADGKR